VGPGFSPLDEELGLLPGALTPTLQAHLSRLGARLSFAVAAEEVWHLKGVRVSAATARRRTEADGAVYAARQEVEAAWVLTTAPPPALGPPIQQVSVDGAMVPVVDGTWREVRTLAIGTVTPAAPGTVRCQARSYFCRMADAARFTTLAAGEVHRRGVETAGVVAGVVDGAEWCQAFLDAHCPEAVRILDFPHAAQRLGAVADAVWGSGAMATAWATTQRHALRDGDPAAVVASLRALPVRTAPDPVDAEARQREILGYFVPRLGQMRYATFRAQGLPIGSGLVESANKLVVEARMKGAGRRWAERHVNPLLALRGALCSDRWAEAWTMIASARRHPPTATSVAPRAAASAASAASVAVSPRRLATPAIPDLPAPGCPRIVNGRPTAAHPWKRFPAVPPSPAKH
jgi:hypothetical protein